MAHKEKIDYLLLDIRELEKKVAGMRDAEIYPVSFFSQSFELAHKILTDLHKLEAAQLEDLSRQMEEHRSRLSTMPLQKATGQPEAEIPEVVSEKTNPLNELKEIADKETALIIDETDPIETTIVYQKANIEPVEEVIQSTEQKSVVIKASVSLNEILEKKNLSDFRKAFSLNDRFRFRRELFGGDEDRMNKAISELNEIHSYEESISFLHNELRWNIEDEAVADFLKLIEKRFS